MVMHVRRPRLALVPFVLAACTSTPPAGDDEASGDSSSDSSSDGASETGSDDATSDSETGEGETLAATLTHHFGEVALAAFEEDADSCVIWTLDNDEALYVQAVTLANLGYWHHSNWFAVPEDTYPGPDGYFKCADRGFTELGAAVAGIVLTAQSTQSFVETQRTSDGAVIKIPPRHAIVSTIHLLNTGPAPIATDLWMTLDLLHPKLVDAVLAPFQLTYFDLDIPAGSEARYTGKCDDFGAQFESLAGKPVDIALHYVLPHYHYLGNYFDLSIVGGELDGQSVFQHQGFNGEANGRAFDPPLQLTGATGLHFTCGYDNWLDHDVGWGNADGEMCVMLGLVDSAIMMDMRTESGTVATGQTPEGVVEFEGPCDTLAFLKNPAQTMPSPEEIAAPLYVPPTQPGDEGQPSVPVCVDHDPSVQPDIAPTLSNIYDMVFNQSCAFNSCHGGGAAAGGLDLHATDLHAALLGHDTQANPGMALVEPGDPDNSWLYQIMSQCAPMGASGVVGHMPRNAPVLLDDRAVALVREWIAAGALDD